MNSLGTTLYVNRGETFILGREVFRSDGYTPYVLSANIPNPYILITVQSDNFRTDKGYKHEFWLNIDHYPAFQTRTPVTILKSSLDGDETGAGTSYYCLYKVADSSQDCGYTFYYSLGGSILYEYEGFKFKKIFTEQVTSEWIEKQYLYNVKLVGGNTMNDLLTGLYESVFPGLTVPDSESEMYKKIKKVKPRLVAGLDWRKPLASITTQEILQKNSKIIVRTC